MGTTRAALTDVDLRTLLKGATPDERAVAAHKLCRTLDREELSAEDRAAAADILRVMAADAAELVRRALAVTLKASNLIPHDVAVKLARDVESISLPMLNFSPVFSDDDLSEIIRLGGPVRQLAIAKRPELSEKVAGAMVEYGSADAVETTLANDNAAFSENILQRALDRFEKSEQVLAAVAYRNALPLSVTERLINMVGDQVRDHLLNNHALSPETALTIAMGAKERATVDLVDQASSHADLPQFVESLNARRALTPSLLLRALARGQMALFEHGMAELAGTPLTRATLMIHDAGPLGLKAIYDRAGLPPRLFQAYRAGVDTWRALQAEGADTSGDEFRHRMLERFLTQRPNAPREDLAYLMERLDHEPLPAKAEVSVAA